MNETDDPMEVPYYTEADYLPTYALDADDTNSQPTYDTMNETAGPVEVPTNDLDAADAATEYRHIPWINDQSANGFTPLHYACRDGNIEMARLLLQRGAMTSIKNKDNFSPFHYASLGGHLEIMALLIAAADGEQ